MLFEKQECLSSFANYDKLFPESTLKRFVARKITRPGVNQNMLNSIEKLSMRKSFPQRTCALVFDEMSLNLNYSTIQLQVMLVVLKVSVNLGEA